MGEQEESETFTGQELCSPAVVMDEVGYIIDRFDSTIFPDERRESTLARWCRREESKFYTYVKILRSQLDHRPDLRTIAEDVVLYRVCVRVLRRVQSNRMNVPGGSPSYAIVIENYKKEYSADELFIKGEFWPKTKKVDEEYPPSIAVELTVIDKDTLEPIPGARIFVDLEWYTSTWKDGISDFELQTPQEDQAPYSIVIKFPGYQDSAVIEISEDTEETVQLEVV